MNILRMFKTNLEENQSKVYGLLLAKATNK